MNLQQLRSLLEVVRQGLKVTAAARAVSVSQPAITKQITQLEKELGAPLFVRERHQLVRLTPVGERIVKLAQEVCLHVAEMKQIAVESAHPGQSRIRIATGHAHAQYILPELMRKFTRRFKDVEFEIRRTRNAPVVSLVAAAEVDLGITSSNARQVENVIFLPYRSWPRILLVPRGHPLLCAKRLSLELIAKYPIISSGAGTATRTDMVNAFAAEGIQPKMHLSAPDFDVVKACVEKGLGIAVLPSYVYQPDRDRGLRSMDVQQFPPDSANIVLRRGVQPPRHVCEFLELLIPGKWDRRISKREGGNASSRA